MAASRHARPSVPTDFSQYNSIPVTVLRMTARRILSKYLNLTCQIPSASNHMPDYTGIAEILDYDYLEICGFEKSPDPFGSILDSWSSGTRPNPTIGKLCTIISTLGRRDVFDEAWPVIVRDIDAWKSRQEELRNYIPVQDETISQSIPEHQVNQFQYMTNDDVKEGKPQHYDAFICHGLGDIDFIKDMIKNLEGIYGLKLCIPARDMLAGGSHNTISARLIEERCTKMVAIISKHFLRSPECDFQIKFAQAVSPGSRSKKLIPVLMQSCEVPNILRHITLCDYTKADLQEWFWKRLANAIQMPIVRSLVDPSEKQILSTIQLPMESTKSDLWQSSSSTSSSSASSSNLSSSSNASKNSAIHSSKC